MNAAQNHTERATAALTDARLIDHTPAAIVTALVGIGHALLALSQTIEIRLPEETDL